MSRLINRWLALRLEVKVAVVLTPLILVLAVVFFFVKGNSSSELVVDEEVTEVTEVTQVSLDEHGVAVTDGKPQYKTLGDVENNDYKPIRGDVQLWNISDGAYIVGRYSSDYSDALPGVFFYETEELRREAIFMESSAPVVVFRGGKHAEVQTLALDDVKAAFESLAE